MHGSITGNQSYCSTFLNLLVTYETVHFLHHKGISKQYFSHGILKLVQQRTFNNFFSLQIKNSLFIKTIRDPIIIGSFRRQVYNYQFVNKLFVTCEHLVYNLPVKSKEIVVSLLLSSSDEGRSMAWSDQNDAVPSALKFTLEIPFLCWNFGDSP